MKLRLDRVLKLELTGLSRQEVFQSGGPVPDFTPPEKWTAPYSPYRKGASVGSLFVSRAAISTPSSLRLLHLANVLHRPEHFAARSAVCW